MKKFNRILEQYVKESESLTRIRLKVDPKDRSGIDFRDFDGYEGYILKEGNYFNVLIEGMDFPIMQVPFSIIKVIDIKDKDIFDRVKIAAIKKINEIKDITPELIYKIETCNSIDFFEEYLKEEGLSESDIKNLYKKQLFFEKVINEITDINPIWDAVKKAAKAAKVAVDKAVPEIPALAKGFSQPVDSTGAPVKKLSPFYFDYAFQTAADDLKKRFDQRKKPEDSATNETKIERFFRSSKKIKIPIARDNDTTRNILNYFNTMDVYTEYLTYNERTGDIFKPKLDNGAIIYIEICNPKITNVDTLDISKVKYFFENLDSASIAKSQYYSFFANTKFTK